MSQADWESERWIEIIFSNIVKTMKVDIKT